jgi:hypothetical protein
VRDFLHEVARQLCWLFAVGGALLSAYGWAFHFYVGPSHGAGFEIGLVFGLISVAAYKGARRLGRDDGQK